MKKKLIIFIIILFSIAGIRAQSLNWMEGSWTGEGYQPNLGKDPYWAMELIISLETGEGILKIEYPSIPCSANWELISKEPKSAVFIEKLITGKNLCVDGGKVIVSYVDKDHISFVFYETEYSTEIYATAKLKRKS